MARHLVEAIDRLAFPIFAHLLERIYDATTASRPDHSLRLLIADPVLAHAGSGSAALHSVVHKLRRRNLCYRAQCACAHTSADDAAAMSRIMSTGLWQERRMLKSLLSSVAFAGLLGSASAADLPSRSAPPVFVAAPVFTWTGFYAGVNAGYLFNGNTRFDRTIGSDANNNAALTAGLRPFANRVDDDGFSVGAQIGYNYQIGGFVLGVEADIAYTDLNRVETLSNTTTFGPLVTPGAPPTTRVNQYRGGLDYLGTVRGRLGYAFDRVMIYGAGGFAYGGVDNRVTFFIPGGSTPFFDGRQDNVKTGYAFGGGIEYAMPTGSFLNVFRASAVTVKVEYLHYELGRDRLAVPGVNGGPGSYTVRARNEGDLVRAGLNYKF